MAARLQPVAEGVWVATSRMYVTTSTVVCGRYGSALLVDPGVTSDEIAALTWDLEALNLHCVMGFSTHPHWDHLLWTQGLGDAPRFASPAAAAMAARDYDDLADQARSADPGLDLSVFGRLRPLADGQYSLAWPGPTVEVIVHDAHASGHAALYLPETGILLAGDMLSDVEIPLLDLDQSDPAADYRRALDRFSRLTVNMVIPGHGHVGDRAEFQKRLSADGRYLDDLVASRPPSDGRLISDWLRQEHTRQMKYLHGHP